MMNYLGEYKAKVVSIDDAKNIGRVQIRVKGLMDGIPDANLPWAKYKSPTPGAKGGSDIRPTVDSKVWVRFAEGDINDAYYSGGVVETNDDLPSASKAGRYILYQSPNKGIIITVDDNSEDIEIKTKNYNTTLGTIIDIMLSHVHLGNSGVDTSPTTLAINRTLPADFNKGNL
jgi:hypothetical protein